MIFKSSATLRGGLMLIGSMSIIGLVDNFILFIADEGGVWQFCLMRVMTPACWFQAISSIASASFVPIISDGLHFGQC